MIGVVIVLMPIALFFKLVKPTPEKEYMKDHFESVLEQGRYIGEEIWVRTR